jgi:nucleotide-binding universal stress UspA family protein
MRHGVTVGIDGSPESLAAAYWAAQEAQARNVALRLVPAPSAPADASDEEVATLRALRMLDWTERDIRSGYPELVITAELIPQDPPTVLLDAARQAEMLVLGLPGIGPEQGFFLEDTSLCVVAECAGPVVFVREDERASPVHDGDVVLGMSRTADELLEFAFGAAATYDAPLRLVHAHPHPSRAYAPWGVEPGPAREVLNELTRELAAKVQPWREKFPTVPVDEDVVLDRPARTIVRAAADARLLVVGRGNRPPETSPVGPVTHAAIHHAVCPVAVVPCG